MEEVMKKILRGILMLTLWMVLCLVPIQANAEGENPKELTQDNYKSYLGLGSYNKSYLPSGSYILMEDITLDYTLLIGCEGQFNEVDFSDVNVTLDLNGYVLRQGNIQEFPVIQVYQGSTLTIQDSRPEVTHKFTADSTGLWKLDEADGDKTVNGGVITGSVKTGLVLQAVDMNKDSYVARCTMNGGNIVGCTHSSYGGGVSVGDKAEFTMNGGSIRGCTATDPQHGFGGGVYVVSGTFTMNGGMISDCASATTDGGDALFMANGANAGKSSFSMSADATINGSFKDANPGASEGSLGVYTVTFNSDGGTPVPPQVRPRGAAAVKPADPTKPGLDFGGWYIGENAYDFTQPVTANLTLTAKWTQHIHCVCGENGNHTDIGDHTAHTDEIWTAWTATDSLPTSAGSYYLVNDVDIAEGSRDWDVYGNIKLCLNGKKVTMNGAAITVGPGELSLTDCGDGGKMIGGSHAAGAAGSVVNLRNHTTLNLYGGSISNINPANRGNSVVCFVYSAAYAAFNMYGGMLGDPDGAVGEDKDGVYIKFADDAKNANIFNAYGGTVRGVISTTIDQENYNEVGNIKFAGTVFESKVYLKKGSTDAPKQSELNGKGEIVYFYPICIYSGTKDVRIDEQNKGDVLGDGGSVSFEYDENGGGGRLTLNDAELSNIVTPIITPFDLEIVLKGNNKITTTREAVFTNKLTFRGNGRLAIETEGESIVCNEMLVNSGDISIFTKSGLALADGNLKLTVNGGTLELATANTNPKYGVLYTTLGHGNVNIALGADRKMIIGNNSDGTDAVLTEATDKATIGVAKFVYIAGPHSHCLCGGMTYDGHDSHTNISWMSWMAADKLPDKAGNYYLVNDVTLPSGTIALPDGVNLCLNGKTVKGTGASYTKLSINGALTVTDCGKAGSFGDLAIIDGAFTMTGSAEIQEGIFHGNVENNGKITGGTFHGNVKNNGRITDGIFYGTVSGTGTIEDSARITVNFDSDGGSVVAPQKILRGQKATAPAAPAKVGFVFGNWTVGGAAFDFTAPITSDTTLRAAWTLRDHSASTAQPTCTEQATCTVCQGKYGKVLGHSYGKPTYTWNGTSCTAERVCGRDASHKETETVTATVTVTQNRTCTRDELSTYTAVFNNPVFAVQKKENVVTAVRLGHNFKVLQYNGTQHWNKCSRCNEISARGNHTGGTATCSAKAECVVCHAKYGEMNTNNHSGLEKVAGVPATAAATGTREYWRCNACGKLFADAAGKNEITSLDMTLEKLAPTIIEGMNGRWNKGCEDALMFRSDAAYEDFIEVLVDGAVISADNYTAREGSIIVELKADYLASLTEGEHTITIRSASGDATARFTVEAMILAPKTEPEDTAAWEIGAVVILGILIVAVVVFVIHKRKTTETD